MSFTINNWRDNMFPIVTKWFDDRLAKRAGLISQVIGVESSDRFSFDEFGVGGVGEIPEYDGNNLDELTRAKGFKTTYETKEKAGKYVVHYKAAKLDLSGQAKKAGRVLADAAALTQLEDFYRLFANGFNSNFAGADGKALFATDHPLNSDGHETFANRIDTAFSVDAIRAAMTAARRFKTYDGMRYLANYDLVLVSPELEQKAIQYFGREAKLLPGGNYNDQNPVAGMRYIIIDGFSAKQWAICDSEQMKDNVKMVETTKPMVMEQKASNPLITEYIAYMDYILGWSEVKQIIGANPT